MLSMKNPCNVEKNSAAGSLALCGLGAALMYYLDPARGRYRRALLRDRIVHTGHKTGDGVGVLSRDLRNRTAGSIAAVRSRFAHDDASDPVIAARVRAKLGRVVSHPGAIGVMVRDGCVTLSGPVLAREVDNLLSSVSAVRGVCEVENRLSVHQHPGDVPALQGGRPRRGERMEIFQENWSPTMRLLAGIAGTGLFLKGTARGGVCGLASSTVGSGLLTRAATNIPLMSLLGVRGRGRAIEVQKTIAIAAPVEEVFSLWSYFENFPRFLSNVREVRDLGDGRSHWVVRGPAGRTIEWTAVVTEYVPNEVLSWRSESDAAVQHAGIIRFEHADDGGTRAHVRLSYIPPAGAVGHGLACLLGSDPKRQLDEDLLRMKTFLETGRPARDASRPEPGQARVGQGTTGQEGHGQVPTDQASPTHQH